VAAVLGNGLGRYEEALVAARQASEHIQVYVAVWALPELIEAAVRTGNLGIADEAVDRLTETARAGGTDDGLGIEARSRALLSEGQAAERYFGEAISRLGHSWRRPELARAHLLYGEWLRRQRRRREARDKLRTALEMFEAMGMEAFAGRTRAELRATGERARPRGPGAPEVFTPQEAQIARMVAGHLTNREIAARLFISASTVEYHLRKIFRKLGITSRTQLARKLHDHEETPTWQD
jgi:DNA-binding CsgD family transcriptional regulator